LKIHSFTYAALPLPDKPASPRHAKKPPHVYDMGRLTVLPPKLIHKGSAFWSAQWL